jgi:hypothetical protein
MDACRYIPGGLLTFRFACPWRRAAFVYPYQRLTVESFAEGILPAQASKLVIRLVLD